MAQVGDQGKVPTPKDYAHLPWIFQGVRIPFVCDRSRLQLSQVLLAGVHEQVGWSNGSSDAVVRLFSSEHYRTNLVLGMKGVELGLVKVAVVDTGAGPCFARQSELSRAKMQPFPKDIPRVVGASGDGLRLRGVIKLTIQLGSLRVTQWFVVVAELPVAAVLGTSFIDAHVEAIYPRQPVCSADERIRDNLELRVFEALPLRCASAKLIPAQTVVYLPVMTVFKGLGVMSQGQNRNTQG